MDEHEQSVQLQLWSFVRKDIASRFYCFLVYEVVCLRTSGSVRGGRVWTESVEIQVFCFTEFGEI